MEDMNTSGENSSHHIDQPSGTGQAAPGKGFTGEELKRRLTNDSGSLGLDIDGTNPGSRSHPTDYRTLTDDPDQINPDNKDLSEDCLAETDHNTGDEHMRIDEEGNELSAEDQA
ncbi:hypothetical protein SAMN06265348_104115 [Pedobacter westerhofensis]|uniref:Uncharacterized protein n=1 Tax=Pedobacter westerhofensis TaxID=425512 RepID=A0A521CQP4_9SPHI|nr:hypothetical protein [Pedobacter westerhofensis]SMO61685.1 hypothetical protein SAMN06265348_104115 [Pedobacter westerhofensis]